jgi:glycosyltransferase involved in cell wall biosynthesis
VLSLVGTVCERKGQLDAILAISKLPPELRHSTVLFIVGAIGEDQYADECAAAAARVPDARIVLTGPVDDPFLYYRAADAALCTSRIESAPRVLIEAMACGLPIITTPVFGIPEIVDEGTNALFYPAGASFELAGQIERLFADEQLRRTMARQSRWVLVAQPGYDEMLQRYERLLREAVNLSMGSFLDPASTFSLRTEPVTD